MRDRGDHGGDTGVPCLALGRRRGAGSARVGNYAFHRSCATFSARALRRFAQNTCEVGKRGGYHRRYLILISSGYSFRGKDVKIDANGQSHDGAKSAKPSRSRHCGLATLGTMGDRGGHWGPLGTIVPGCLQRLQPSASPLPRSGRLAQPAISAVKC